jgi:hypothetical protein
LQDIDMRSLSTIAKLGVFVIVAALNAVCVSAAQPQDLRVVPMALAVRKDISPPPAGVAELKFRDIFKMPVGDRGLEPSAKLLALDGKRVRIVGFMIQQQPEPIGQFLLSPLPATISDEDEPLADDLAPSVVTVSVPGAADKAIPLLPGLIRVSGVLHVGASLDAASGRVSSVQVLLDAKPARALLALRAQRVAKRGNHNVLRSERASVP